MEEVLKQILTEMKDIKIDLRDLRTDVAELKTDVRELKTDVAELKTDVENLKLQVSENTQILKALEHSAEVNRAEHNKMFYDIAEIRGELIGIKGDLNIVEMVTSKNWHEITKLKATGTDT